MQRLVLAAALAAGAFALAGPAAADDRTRYPAWLKNSYIDFGPGYIDYPFSQDQLEPGYRAATVRIPHAGARVTLFGHNFTRHLSAQITYLRPVQWVGYIDINGQPGKRTVWMNIAGLTVRGTMPLGGPFSTYAEGGLGIVTRHGFGDDGHAIVEDATYATVLVGTGLKARLSRIWDLQAGVAYTPPNGRYRQPHTVMVSGSAVLNMRPRSPEQLNANTETGTVFPKHLVQVGYATDRFGTGVNHFVSSTVPIFWGGNAAVERGFVLRYQRNVFHTAKVFSLDWGASIGTFRTAADGTRFSTVSVYPQMKFRPVRTRALDVYLSYAVAGPTYISKTSLDGHDTGRHFTFQDLMGLGCNIGRGRHVNLEAGIGHYSNGNIFPHNAGVKIPLTFTLGYAF